MKFLEALRKGFGFFLMSLGVSAPAKKPAPRPGSTGPAGKAS